MTKKERQKKYRAEHKEYFKECRKKYYLKNKEKMGRDKRKLVLKNNFGITEEQFNEMLKSQDNRCGICNNLFRSHKPFNPNVDHNHATNKIRGLLCGQCNRSIGLLRDDPAIIKNAIKWITERK